MSPRLALAAALIGLSVAGPLAEAQAAAAEFPWFVVAPLWEKHRPPPPKGPPYLSYDEWRGLKQHPCIAELAAFSLGGMSLVDRDDKAEDMNVAEATDNLLSALGAVSLMARNPYPLGSYVLPAGTLERLGYGKGEPRDSLMRRFKIVPVPGAPKGAPTHVDESIRISGVLTEDFPWFKELPKVGLFRIAEAGNPGAAADKRDFTAPPYVLLRLNPPLDRCRQALEDVKSLLHAHSRGLAFASQALTPR